MTRLIVLSGPVGAGKSSFAGELVGRGAVCISTRAYLKARLGTPDDRVLLQSAGERLDLETGGAWVADAVNEAIRDEKSGQLLLLDSARTCEQLAALRRRWSGDLVHVHLHANLDTLERRHAARSGGTLEPTTYAQVRENAAEADLDRLLRKADLVLDTDFVGPFLLAETAVRWMDGRAATTRARLVDVVVGGQYGSEGKGNVCAHLASRYDVLMRIGGPNAGHLVKDPDYKYVQLPSGTKSNPRAAILVGAGSTLWLPQLLKEISDLELTPERLSIDPQAMVIEESDRALEAAALGSISSTKQGVGAASARKIANRGDKAMLGEPVRLSRDCDALRPFVRDVRAELDRHYAKRARIMLEGTQGTLLSLHHGFWPHVTSRETSAAGCLSDAGIPPARVRKVILVVRTYPIRVGGPSGWMGRNVSLEELAGRSGIPIDEFRRVEKGTISGIERRVAEFDWTQLRRASELNGATDIALTFADYIGVDNRRAKTFEDLSAESRELIRRIEQVTETPVTLVSKEFARDGVIERNF